MARMTPYQRGHRLELDVIADLDADGYETMHAAASKGKIDVLAFKPGQILVIQVKINGRISPSERATVIRLARILYGIPIVASKRAGRKKPIYERLTGTGPHDRTPFRTDEITI